MSEEPRSEPLGELDDRALLAAHVAGREGAFGELFGRHRDRLWAVALRTTGHPEDAADGLQDGMVAAFRRAGSYRGDAAVTTWLHRVVVNACLDRMRAMRSRRAESLEARSEAREGRDEPEARDRSRSPHDPADTVVSDERRALVLAALQDLAAPQRAAVVLVDMEGYSVAEAAEILGCAQGTVKSRCSRGRARLAVALADLVADERLDREPAHHGRRNPQQSRSVTPEQPRGPPAED